MSGKGVACGAALLAGALLPNSGCAGGSSAADYGPPGHSRYRTLEVAPTFKQLEGELYRDAPSARTYKVVARKDGKRTLNFIRGRHLVLQVTVWRKPDGTWRAAQWGQCID
jgi:hypothetical protein